MNNFFWDNVFFLSVGSIGVCFIINILLGTYFNNKKIGWNFVLFSFLSLCIVLIVPIWIVCILGCLANVILSCYGIIRVINELNEKTKKTELELAVKEKEMSLMLSQIKPHFIYNTLNTIQYLCRTDADLASETIADFSEYLRTNLSISAGKQSVSFLDELEHVKRYLKIEKLRFKHRLKVKYIIQAEDFDVPVLSIQPLVENAVKHGMTNRMNGITVVVSSYRTENENIVQISDDGIGFNEKNIENKNDSLGLNNVKVRIETLFKGKLQIESVENAGTTVKLIFPIKK